MPSNYPVEIDLGRKMSETNCVAPAPAGKGRKVIYPTLYIDQIDGMPAVPKEGRMIIEFRRTRMSVEENMEGKQATGLTLEIRKMCLPKEDGDETLEDAFKKLGRGEVASDGAEYGYEDAEDDE